MELARRAWSAFARDIVVVILGVLIALAVGDWTSERADRRLEAQYLRRLTRDLRADSAMLAQYQRSALAGESAARQLLAVLAGGSPVPDSTVAREFSEATRGAYLAPNTPTIDELKSTGNLRVLRSDGLRDAILSYYASLVWAERSLETVMQRGRDPLGEVGWDIRAFDPAGSYAVNLGQGARSPQGAGSGAGSTLARRFRAHPEAERATRRAVTYNAMLQPIVESWQRHLAALRRQMPN